MITDDYDIQIDYECITNDFDAVYNGMENNDTSCNDTECDIEFE